MRGGLSLGKPFGVQLNLDWSVLVILVLVVSSLSLGFVRYWHPDWSGPLVLAVSLAGGALLLFSIAAHELSHALVARRLGMPVRSITLFVFGGITDVEREPETPKAELLMAVVGPLTSIGLGLVFSWIAGVSLRSTPVDPGQPLRTLSHLGPLTTILAWIGPVNLVLGLFNLVPAFPLDGGRMLRALLWAGTKDLRRATALAAAGGRLFGWLLIGLGVSMALGVAVPFFGRGLVGGLWLVLIGWFILSAAQGSYLGVVARELLAGVPVSRLAREPRVVDPDLSVSEFIEQHLLTHSDSAFAVVEDDRLVGIATLADVRRVPAPRRPFTRVADIMTPRRRLATLPSTADGFAALQLLGQRGVAQVPLLAGGDRLAGMVYRNDVVRWLALHGEELRRPTHRRVVGPSQRPPPPPAPPPP